MDGTLDKAFTDLAVSKGLVDPAAATLALGRATGLVSVVDILVETGCLTWDDAASLTAEIGRPEPPEVLGGYRIRSKLGAGGMGAVYRATQLSMNREVALKVLHPHIARDRSFSDRFTREARVAGLINHPNVVTCFDAGSDQGMLYMALELISGGDAAQLMKRRNGRLSEDDVLRIGIDCARGLEAIEDAGLIHRDIKPANIFLTGDPARGGRAKLGDLGLARPRIGEERMTISGSPIGTPAFMSPEQARGARDLDIRSDIYSLGAALFDLASGAPPFSGTSVYAIVSQVITAPTPDARDARPDVSASLAEVIKRAMARSRDDRYRRPGELRDELERIRGGILPLAFSQSLGANLATGMLTRPAAPAPTTRTVRRAAARRRGPVTIALAITAAVAMVSLVSVVVVGIASRPKARLPHPEAQEVPEGLLAPVASSADGLLPPPAPRPPVARSVDVPPPTGTEPSPISEELRPVVEHRAPGARDLLPRIEDPPPSGWHRDQDGLIASGDATLDLTAAVPSAYDLDLTFTLPESGALVITVVHAGRACDWPIGDASEWGLAMPHIDGPRLVPPPPFRGVRHQAHVRDRADGLTVLIDGVVVDAWSPDRGEFAAGSATPDRVPAVRCRAATGCRIHAAELTSIP